MPPPTTIAGKLVLDECTALYRALNYRLGDFKALADLKKNFAETARLRSQVVAASQGIKDAKQATKDTAALYKDLNKRAKEIGVTANESKKLWDRLLSKIPGGNKPQKAAAAGGSLAALLLIGGIAAIQIIIATLQRQVNNSNIENIDRLIAEQAKTATLAINNQIQIRTLRETAKAQDIKINDVREEILKSEVNANSVRKKLNDITYEVRQGRKIVEEKIEAAKKQANDALYEVRKGREKLELNIRSVAEKVETVSTGKVRELALSVDSKISSVRSTVEKLNPTSKIDIAVNSVKSSLTGQIENLKSRISGIESTATKASQVATSSATKAQMASENGVKVIREFTNTLSQNYKQTFEYQAAEWNRLQRIAQDKILKDFRLETIIDAQNGVDKQYQDFLKRLDTELKNAGLKGDSPTAPAPLSAKAIERIEVKLGALQEAQKNDSSQFATRLNNVEKAVNNPSPVTPSAVADAIKKEITPLEKRIGDVEKNGAIPLSVKKITDNITKEQEQLKKQVETLNPIVIGINTRLKEQEKVNATAIPKLDQILQFLPLIPARAADAIRPSIPTIPQIETAAATGTCRTTQPGGCSRRMIDDAVGNINNNTNNSNNNLLNKINLLLQGIDLSLLGVINNKLGDQLPGGIGGKLTRFTQWLQLDRALNVLTFAATVHNGFMLSNDIGQTLLGALGNILLLIGLKDDDGQAFDIGSIINSTIENFVKSIVGAENYQAITTAWAKANRIYQASVNALNAFQGLASSILTGLEMTAGKVAKIGNALRKSGEVLESAYGWMNPQPKFNRVTQFLEGLQNGASTIQMVTQAPLDVINATTELTNATTELTNAIKSDGTEANKGKESPEPEQLKATESAAKLASSALELVDLDLDPDE